MDSRDDSVTPVLPLLAKRPPVRQKCTFAEFLWAFWPLSLISFGGPQACVAMFYSKFVDVHDNSAAPSVSEDMFLELYALAQSLPGPTATKLAALLGAKFGGVVGAAVTTIVWLLPGFIIMSSVGSWFHAHLQDRDSAVFMQHISRYAVGLIASAFSFVILAAYKLVYKIVGMDKTKAFIANVSMGCAVLAPARHLSWISVFLLLGGGLFFFLKTTWCTESSQALSVVSSDSGDEAENAAEAGEERIAFEDDWDMPVSTTEGITVLALVMLITATIFVLPWTGKLAHLARVFWRIGLSVYGGALVIVPMLLTEFVDSGLLPNEIFLAAFGLFGCVPGPMVSLVAFIGAATYGWTGAILGTIAVNSPGIMLQLGLLPFWDKLRRYECAQVCLQGANSAAAGLIVAGVWMLMDRAVTGPAAYVMMITAGSLTVVYKAPTPLVVIGHGIVGLILVHFDLGLKHAAVQ